MRPLTRSATAAAVLLLAACASGGTPGMPRSPDRGSDVEFQPVVIDETGTAMRANITVGPERSEVSATPERVWLVLPDVYRELGIEVKVVDEPSKLLGNSDFYRTRQLGGERISGYLNCGETMSGPAADLYRIRISLQTRVMPNPQAAGTSIIETRVRATAQDHRGASTDAVQCTSNGGLEQRVRQMITLRIANG